MDLLSPELCTKIFSFACTDGGSTGRALCLVSRYVHQTSKPYRFQSIALEGIQQELAFASLLEQTPPNMRQVRNLLVGRRPPEIEDASSQFWSEAANRLEDFQAEALSDEENEETERELQEKLDRQFMEGMAFTTARKLEWAEAFQTILEIIADSLEVLDMDIGGELMESTVTGGISLPFLTDLTVRGRIPSLGVCPLLLRLHIESSLLLDGHFASFAPNITCLRISGIHPDRMANTSVDIAAGLINNQLPSLRNIQISVISPPQCENQQGYKVWFRQICSMKKPGGPWNIFLSFDEHQSTPSDHINEWLTRINGGVGCWQTRGVDDLDTGSIIGGSDAWRNEVV